MQLYDVDEIRVTISHDRKVNQLSRKAIIELINRYEDFYTNNPDDDIVDFNTFLNFYNNSDLKSKLHPDEQAVLEVVHNLIDEFEDLLDEYDIMIPCDDRDNDEYSDTQAAIYGETYYNLEDIFRQTLHNLLGDNEECCTIETT